MVKIKSLESLVDEVKGDLKDAKKKNVFLDKFTYKNHKEELVRTDNFGGLLRKICEFALEKREQEEDRKKEQTEFKKYAAQITRADLETEKIPSSTFEEVLIT